MTNGTAPIKVGCPATSPGNCSGSLTLLTAKNVRFGGLNAVLRIGSARYNLAHGASGKIASSAQPATFALDRSTKRK